MKNYLLLFTLCLAAAPICFAQSSGTWATTLNVFHQDWGINFDPGSLQTTHPVSIRPGFALGLERSWHEGKKQRVRVFQDVHLGFWHNPYSENYTFLGTRLGSDFRLWQQLRLTPSVLYRIGRAKTEDVRYVYSEEKWVPSGNLTPGFLRHNLGLDLQLSWRFAASAAHPLDVQVGANSLVAWKYMPTEVAENLFLYQALRLGLRYGF
jgi:hypothetical protein